MVDVLGPRDIAPVEVLTSANSQILGSGPGTQAPDSYLQEFRESRRIVEDIQRGTLEHTYFAKGHPNEAYLDAGLTGLGIGNPHPWWGSDEAASNDVAKDMYLIRREFTKLTDRAAKGDRWTKITLLYQRRTCPYSYEEDRQTSSTTFQTWWGVDPAGLPRLINKSEGYPVLVPQLMLRRHWPHVTMDITAVENLDNLQNTTNGSPFAGQPINTWLLESIVSKRLYGSGSDRAPAPSQDHYEISITWRGDPRRHHELWIARFARRGLPVTKPASMSFEDLAAVHDRTVFYPASETDFDHIIADNQTCKRVI